jgi:hypothetical protein
MEYPQPTSGNKLNFEILIVIMSLKISNIYPNEEVLVFQYINQQMHSVHSFSNLSYDRSITSSIASSPHSAI